MYKEDLALNNPQRLYCHKTQPIQTKPNQNHNHRQDMTQDQFLCGVKYV